jgi:hypothetical protein
MFNNTPTIYLSQFPKQIFPIIFSKSEVSTSCLPDWQGSNVFPKEVFPSPLQLSQNLDKTRIIIRQLASFRTGTDIQTNSLDANFISFHQQISRKFVDFEWARSGAESLVGSRSDASDVDPFGGLQKILGTGTSPN